MIWKYLTKLSEEWRTYLKRSIKELFWNERLVEKTIVNFKNELDQLSVQTFYFNFLDDFGEYKNVQDKIHVFTVDDTLQSMNSNYCRPFQLYFYYNLFEPFENSVVAQKKSQDLIIYLRKSC